MIITRLQYQSYMLSLLKLLFSAMGHRAVWYTVTKVLEKSIASVFKSEE